MGGWFRSTFSSFSVPAYRVLWLGSTLAMLTFMMSWVVQSVVAFELLGTNTAVGLVSVGSGVAMLVLGPFGGVFADRLSKRRMLFAGQSLVALVYLTLGVLVLTDRITIVLLVATTFVMGLSFSLIGPVRQAYVGEIAPPKLLANAVALSSLSQMFSRIISPTIAGILIGIAVIGPGGTYVAMAAMMTLVLVTVWMLPNVPPRPTDGRSVLRDFREGLAYVVGEPQLRFLASMFILVVLIGFPFQVILPGLLEHELGRPARTVGFMLGVSAIGGFAAGMALAGFASSRFATPVQLLLGALFGAALVGLAMAPTFEVALGMVFLAGLGSGGFQMLNQAQLMTITAPAYHGRVMSLQMLAWGGNGLMSLPLGATADGFGERVVLAGMGVGVVTVLLVGMAAYRLFVPRREPPLEPVPVLTSPRPALAARPSANGAVPIAPRLVPARLPLVAPRPVASTRATTRTATNGAATGGAVATGAATNGAVANGAATNGAASPRRRRRVGRDFMTGGGVIVGRDYM